MKERFLYLRRLSETLAKVRLLEYIFEQTWATIVGNQPEHSMLLGEIQRNINALKNIALAKVEAECNALETPEPDNRVYLGFRPALDMIPKTPTVQVSTMPTPSCLVCGDWPRQDVIDVIWMYPPQLSGPFATKAGYGLAVEKPGQLTLFIQTVKE